MRLKNKATLLLSASWLFFSPCLCLGQESFPFPAEIVGDGINIRLDSTINSPVLGTLDKGQLVTVVFGHYGWYKIILPKDIPVFIKDDFVSAVQPQAARVINDRVNIRTGPSDSSSVIGMASKGDILNVLGRQKIWYKIEPPDSCFGWVHKQFIRKLAEPPKPAEEANNKDEPH